MTREQSLRRRLEASTLSTVRFLSAFRPVPLRNLEDRTSTPYHIKHTGDQGIKSFKLYHKTHLALLGLTPVAVAASPSILNYPIDFALALTIPLHAHIGMNWVISDYVPPGTRKIARVALAGLTLATVAGLLKLNFDGPGVTESVKGLWREPKTEE